jgi:ParB family transcriptional regulator, chromosome partitioning protein
MAGRRTSLASLAGEKVEDVPGRDDPTLVRLSLSAIVPTPLNKRTNFGTPKELAELGESMRRQQLQPIVVVSRASYLKLFPEHTEHAGTATYVIANGERRYRGASEVKLGTIEAVIRESIAASRQDFLDAVASENLDRRNLDPIEEAHTVEALVAEFGSARAVAQHRGKHETWVSQRRSLLRLSPAMQELVRSRELPVEKARKLAKAVKDHGLDDQQQAEWWKAEQERSKEPVREQPPTAEAKPDAGDDLTAVKSPPPPKRTRATEPAADPPAGPENLTAVKSGASEEGASPAAEESDSGAEQPHLAEPVPSLPWDSPPALDRLLRHHMTSENRIALAKLLAVI